MMAATIKKTKIEMARWDLLLKLPLDMRKVVKELEGVVVNGELKYRVTIEKKMIEYGAEHISIDCEVEGFPSDELIALIGVLV